jgi:hypothetical protein
MRLCIAEASKLVDFLESFNMEHFFSWKKLITFAHLLVTLSANVRAISFTGDISLCLL